MEIELIASGVAISGMMVVLQAVAWKYNKNGKITALVSAVIGGIAGAMFGLSL